MNVGKPFTGGQISLYIRERTQEKSLMNVLNVEKHFVRRPTSGRIKEFILVRNHMNVKNVAKLSPVNHTSLNI